jgi:hypothetical protein
MTSFLDLHLQYNSVYLKIYFGQMTHIANNYYSLIFLDIVKPFEHLQVVARCLPITYHTTGQKWN